MQAKNMIKIRFTLNKRGYASKKKIQLIIPKSINEKTQL